MQIYVSSLVIAALLSVSRRIMTRTGWLPLPPMLIRWALSNTSLSTHAICDQAFYICPWRVAVKHKSSVDSEDIKCVCFWNVCLYIQLFIWISSRTLLWNHAITMGSSNIKDTYPSSFLCFMTSALKLLLVYKTVCQTSLMRAHNMYQWDDLLKRLVLYVYITSF